MSSWELTRAYAALARGGDDARCGRDGAADTGAARVGNRPSWVLVTDMLADSHARAAAFGVDSVLALPFPAAVKTGTSSDFRDTWTVGFTRDYTVGVWVGNFDGTPMQRRLRRDRRRRRCGAGSCCTCTNTPSPHRSRRPPATRARDLREDRARARARLPGGSV